MLLVSTEGKPLKKTHISSHADWYIRKQERTRLSPEDLVERNNIKAYVTLGMSKKGIFYRLVWDCVLDVGIILLVSYCQRYRNDVIVSIWEQHFKLPRDVVKVTPELVADAKAKYLEKIQVVRN
ncbi:MAG: hypothetical protein RLZZ76_157 [Candidatus Parcubacteria bacterium]|jgi:hypothetical protein